MDNAVISKEAAEHLNVLLRSACTALNEAVQIASTRCDPEFQEPFKRHIGEAMAIVGWDILETMIYTNHPELRPYTLARDETGT